MKTLGNIGLENFAVQYALNHLRDGFAKILRGKIALRVRGPRRGASDKPPVLVVGQPVETVLPVCDVAFGLSASGFGVCFGQAGAMMKARARMSKPEPSHKAPA